LGINLQIIKIGYVIVFIKAKKKNARKPVNIDYAGI